MRQNERKRPFELCEKVSRLRFSEKVYFELSYLEVPGPALALHPQLVLN